MLAWSPSSPICGTIFGPITTSFGFNYQADMELPCFSCHFCFYFVILILIVVFTCKPQGGSRTREGGWRTKMRTKIWTEKTNTHAQPRVHPLKNIMRWEADTWRERHRQMKKNRQDRKVRREGGERWKENLRCYNNEVQKQLLHNY